MSNKKIFAAISLLLLSSGWGWAKTWTLQECIDYALANNITIKQSRLRAQQSHEDVLQSRSALFPSVSFSTNHNMSYRPFSETTYNLTNGSMVADNKKVMYNGSYGINANWVVWNGNRNRMQIKQNKLTEEQNNLATEQQANSIQEQIVQLYVQILYETEAVRVNQSIVAASIAKRDRAKEMVEVGTLSRADLAQLEAQVTQDQYSLVSAQSQLANFKLQLKQLLEIHDNEEFDVADPNTADATVLQIIPDKAEVYNTALANRPEIKAVKLNIESGNIAIKSARTGYMPNINLTAGIGTNNASGQHTAFTEQVKKNLSNSLGLTLSVPIFDNLQARTNIRKAKFSHQSSLLELENQQKKLYSTVEKYWLDATTSQQQYIFAKANCESMQQSFELVSEQFDCGLKNIVELTTGKNNLLQAEQQMLQTKYTALLNRALLRFYQGENITL